MQGSKKKVERIKIILQEERSSAAFRVNMRKDAQVAER